MSVEDYFTDFENAQELVQQANADILDFTDLVAKKRIVGKQSLAGYENAIEAL